jgi:hypothetical protein
MLSMNTHRTNVLVPARVLSFALLAALAFTGQAMAAATVASLTLSPAAIAGGTGGTSTATITLSEAAPAGGTVVTIATSSPGLAASVQSVRVPAGATTASFSVATNPKYRRYSSLAFTATISASAGGTIASAVLNVTAQPRPADIDGDSTQRFGTVCGGNFPARGGDHGILFDCQVGPDFGTVGKCSFRQECLLGCTTKPSSNFEFFDVCATSGPYPIDLAPAWIEGGNPATANLRFASPAPSGSTTAMAIAQSTVATAFPTGFRPVAAGTTNVPFTVATSVIPSVQFAEVDANFEIPTPTGGGAIHNADRTGLAWLAIAPPPQNPPAAPQPVLGFFEISPEAVTGGKNSSATIWLSGISNTGGPTVALSSSNAPVASLPTSTTIAPGSNVAVETVTTSAVASATTVTLTATEGPRSLASLLTVTPASCVPTTCATQGKNCGTIPDGCGGTLTCGTCSGSLTCGGGGVPNVCAVPPPPPPPAGFESPAANAADSGGDGNGFESVPSNAHALDAVTASDINSGSDTGTSCTSTGKDRHRFFNYGFAIPSGSSITGIEVRLDARADSTSGAPKMCVQLSWDGGVTWTAAKSSATLATNLGAFTLGSASDTWGRTWSAANFADASFRLRVINVSSSTSSDFFLDWVGVRAHSIVPGPASLNAVTVSPSAVVGGNTSTGTVTLTAGAPSGGAVVSLVSSNTGVATVPASVPIAAGATSATFSAMTAAVGTSTSVTLSATYSGVTRTATLTVSPQAGDTVAIQRAEYTERDDQLRVEATSTSATATLQVFVTSTNQLIGTLTNNGGGRYSGTFTRSTNPQNITVRSSLGGSASRNVTVN